MKLGEVPQDNNVGYEDQQRAVYAENHDGRYVIASSTGWQVEDAANSIAVTEFQRLAELAMQRHKSGISCALEVHMYHLRMDIPTLAQATGIAQWRVRRHLRAAHYPRLKSQLQQRYADALGVAVEALNTPPELPTAPYHD